MSMRYSTDIRLLWPLVLLLSACASAPAPQDTVSKGGPPAGAAAPSGTAGAAASSANGSGPSAQGAAQALVAPPSPRETADFDRAVGFMRGGNTTEAELEFKQMTLAYPNLSAPYVNLGILYRKTGHLDQSEDALKNAVQRNATSAIAWNELGATQRLRGKFPDAAASYEKAIAADGNYAAAWRNLGVVSDLYLGDPERALTALEKYKELTGEDRPVTSWIAELRQRTGKPPLKPAAAADKSGGNPASGSGGASSSASEPTAPAPAAPTDKPAAAPADTPPTAPAPKSGD